MRAQKRGRSALRLMGANAQFDRSSARRARLSTPTSMLSIYASYQLFLQ